MRPEGGEKAKPGAGPEGWVGRVGLLLASLLVAVLVSEAALRLLAPEAPRPPQRLAEPTVHQPDAVLGWRNKGGSYELPPYSPSGAPISMRFAGDGSRRTSAEPRAGGTPLLIFGGSFAQGWAISDDETLAWKLQLRFPGAEVSNYGTGGHGGYQSLLFQERELPRRRAGSVALYVFTGHHTTRNVAPPSWMRLLSQTSGRGHIDVPYATLDAKGELVRHAPERWSPWPLADWLRVADFLQHRVAGLRERWSGGRTSQERAVSERVLLEMDAFARSRDAHFAVALLSAKRGKLQHYRRFLERHEIAAVDCNSFPLRRDQIVIGEGHPNGRMNTEWAGCVGDFLEARFGAALGGAPSQGADAGG